MIVSGGNEMMYQEPDENPNPSPCDTCRDVPSQEIEHCKAEGNCSQLEDWKYANTVRIRKSFQRIQEAKLEKARK